MQCAVRHRVLSVEHFALCLMQSRITLHRDVKKGQDGGFHLAPSPARFRALEIKSRGRPSRLKPGGVPDSSPTYDALIVIRFRAGAFTSLGRVTVSTPFLNTASALLASTLPESGIDRLKEPYERSARK